MPHTSPGITPTHPSLASRLITAVLALVVGCAIGLASADPILAAIDPFNCWPESVGCLYRQIDPAEGIALYRRVAGVVGVVLASPVLVYQVIGIAAPEFAHRERRTLWTMLPLLPLVFGLGAYLAIAYVVPTLISFLAPFMTRSLGF